MKIILCTDKDADKILSTEFPIEAGLAGRVFRERIPSYVNKAKSDPNHFTKVDEAAGTKTGEGLIMTLPIFHGESVCGIIQLMKLPGDEFKEIDLTIAERLINNTNIGEKLSNIQRNPHTDIPSIASFRTTFISACFTDINHYKLIVSAMSLGSAVSLLNDYYRRLLSRAYRYEIKVEEYLGDGLYLSFHNESKSGGARQAISCALDLQAEYEELYQSWKTLGYPVRPDNYHNVGISSGQVYDGTIGHPRDRRSKLIGACINEAAYLVEKGKELGSCILISKETK